jgi:hypothetical protein
MVSEESVRVTAHTFLSATLPWGRLSFFCGLPRGGAAALLKLPRREAAFFKAARQRPIPATEQSQLNLQLTQPAALKMIDCRWNNAHET